MGRPVSINKTIPISQIRRVKRDLQKFIELYDKVTFIEDLYNGETVVSAIEKKNKTPQTGYKWLKEWNESGFDGLYRKEGSGRQSKLSQYQFQILSENIVKKGLSSVSDIKTEVQKEFGVVYSERHLRRIIFELGLDEFMQSDDKN